MKGVFFSLKSSCLKLYPSKSSSHIGTSASNRARGACVAGKGVSIWFRNWGAFHIPNPPKSLNSKSHVSLVFDQFSDFHMRELDWCICVCVGGFVSGLGLFCVLVCVYVSVSFTIIFRTTSRIK